MGTYISAIKSLYQFAKFVAFSFLAPKIKSQKLAGKLEETLLSSPFYQPAPPVKEEGYCPDNQPTKVL